MRTMILAAGVAAVAGLAGADGAMAGAIERACLSSDRPGASRALCACIQSVADQTLTRREQKMAADFFRNPDRAQDVRMSKKDDHNDFWKRYKNFGETAAAYCSIAG